MPTYDYVCSRCGHRMEVVHAIHGHGPKVCPDCGTAGSMTKSFAPPAIHFKGSGWAKKDRSATVTPGKAKPAADPAPAGGTSAAASDGSSASGGPATAGGGTAAPSGAPDASPGGATGGSGPAD
jgi:putative FmdB family regulatory protein